MSVKTIQTFAWDADARTIDHLAGDGSFSFSVGKAIGVVCGLNDQNNGRDYFEIDHAFYIDSDGYRVIENGVYKTSIRVYLTDSVFKIERLSQKVRYFVDDKLIYTSLKPSAGVVFGDCSLYAYLDSVLDACLVDYSDAIPTDLSTIENQIQEAKDLLQNNDAILEEISEYLDAIAALVREVEALLTGSPVTIDGVAELWEDVLELINALLEEYGDSPFVQQLNDLINQVNDIIQNGLGLDDVETVLELINEILDLIDSSDSFTLEEVAEIWEGVSDSLDLLATQNPTDTFIELLDALSSQVDYLLGLDLGDAGSGIILDLINVILDLIDLGDEALLADFSIGLIPVGPLAAIGIDADANVGYIGVGPFSVTSTEKDLSQGRVGIGPLWAIGYDGDAAFGVAEIGPLASTGLDIEEAAPDFSTGSAYLGPLGVYSYEGILDVNNGAVGLGPVWGFGSDDDVVVGVASIGPLYAIGDSQPVNYLYAGWPSWSASLIQLVGNTAVVLTVPAPILIAKANDYDNIRLVVTVPAPILTAYTGAVASLVVPAPVLTSTGTVQAVARAELEVPAPELTATATNSILASVELEVPAPILTAATGAYASLEVLAPILASTGRVEGIARIELTVPAPELTATGTVGSVASVVLEVPAPILTATGIVGAIAQVVLIVPAPILTASAQVSPGVGLPATTVATETTYTVNLTTGAVTTLLLGGLDKLVTAHGRLYGLRSGELIRLDGDLDGSATIPATVRFAPQVFGSNRAKRFSTVYLDAREDDGLTLDVIADENAAWRYQTATDTARAYGTHKVKVGRGVKFHTAGLVIQNRNGGRMDIGGMELLVDTGAPRPKT